MTQGDAKEFGKQAFRDKKPDKPINDNDFVEALPEPTVDTTPGNWKELVAAWHRGWNEARILDELGFTDD